MNELQTVEFNLLKTFTSICDKLGIQYYAVCGTVLGAVKYNAFIPWDDDCDIAMLREDYNIFLQFAPSMLPKKYFLQNYHTDSMFPQMFSKLRDSNTTFIEKTIAEIDINHGVYIDIFPLDEYPKSLFRRSVLEMKKKIYYRRATTIYAQKRTGLSELLRRWNLFFHYNYKTQYCVQRLDNLLSSCKDDKSNLLCNHGNWQGKLEYAPREQYGDGTWATFEGLQVRIPERYDEYLTQKYGDWRSDLPEDQKVGHHYAEVIDLTRPYTDYIVKLKNGKIRLKTSEELLSAGITPPEGYRY